MVYLFTYISNKNVSNKSPSFLNSSTPSKYFFITRLHSKILTSEMNYPFAVPSLRIQIIYFLQKIKDALLNCIKHLVKYLINNLEFTTIVTNRNLAQVTSSPYKANLSPYEVSQLQLSNKEVHNLEVLRVVAKL